MKLGNKRRSESLLSITCKIKFNYYDSTKALYVTIVEKNGMIHEIFGEFGKSGTELLALLHSLSQILSKGFQACESIGESKIYRKLVIDQLRHISGQCYCANKGDSIKSIPDGIAYALEKEILKHELFKEYR